MVPRKAKRFMEAGVGWNYIAMDQAIRDAGPRGRGTSSRAHRHHHGLRRTVDARHRRRRRHSARQGAQEGRALRGAEGHVLGPVRRACNRLPDQGRELFDFVGVRDLGPLHRQRDRAHPVGQAGRNVRGRLRGARLDAVRPVRRHGRHVVEVQRHAGQGQPRLRQGPRRLRDRRRRRRGGAGGADSAPRPRRQDLRRGRRLRRHLRRLRHGGALGRRRGALHAHGHRKASTARESARSTTSTRTAPARRSATSARSRRSARCSARTCRRSQRPSR